MEPVLLLVTLSQMSAIDLFSLRGGCRHRFRPSAHTKYLLTTGVEGMWSGGCRGAVVVDTLERLRMHLV
jgi:hypothetical protein